MPHQVAITVHAPLLHGRAAEFVRVRGGASFFLPGVAALRHLARMSPEEA